MEEGETELVLLDPQIRLPVLRAVAAILLIAKLCDRRGRQLALIPRLLESYVLHAVT